MIVPNKFPTTVVLIMFFINITFFSSSASAGFPPPHACPPLQEEKPTKFDEYPSIRLNDEKARLDSFAVMLQNDPTAQGYIIGYGGKICVANEALARAKRARDYLHYTRGLDRERIVTVNGGYRKEGGSELYIVPRGASKPRADPNISRCTKSGRRNSR